MDSFAGKLAVVTGGGTGMGRELVVQLTAHGCSVATCDLNEQTLKETAVRAAAIAPPGATVSTHLCDVGDSHAVERFRDAVITAHQADRVDLLFNNAGIDGFVSFAAGQRALWERTFGVCWGGVYNCSRAFLPLLIASGDAYLVNTSSVNGFRANHPGAANTAYSTAKFAVKGFSEALIEDFRLHAPNVKVALVMPGAVATELGVNSSRILGSGAAADGDSEPVRMRRHLVEIGVPVDDLDEHRLRVTARAYAELFVTPAGEAARIILDEVLAGSWRILVGDDAHELDLAVRVDPDGAYQMEGPSIANRDAVVGLLELVGRFDPDAAGPLTAEYELHLGPRTVRCGVRAGTLELQRGSALDPVAVIATDPAVFRRLIENAETLDSAMQRGTLKLTGSMQEFDRLLRAVVWRAPLERTARVTTQQSITVDLTEPVVSESFAGKLAVVTGGGTGMGRALVVQLATEGCSVATCDLNETTLAETAALARATASAAARVTTHLCDVADERAVERFRDQVIDQHRTDRVDLFFNNAGIVASNSFVAGDRHSWERVFDVCWGGVYNCSRAFLPLLVAGERPWLVNTSSIQGFWIDGPGSPCTAYGTAKFAVKGLSEALIEDFRLHAPHVRVAVVLPGHISTDIGVNSARILGPRTDDAEPERLRGMLVRRGLLPVGAADDDVERVQAAAGELAGEFLMSSSASAARIILDGVRARRWRILVGDDAHRLDQAVRSDPQAAYALDSQIPAIYQGWFVPLVALRAFFDADHAAGWSGRVQLRDGRERISIQVSRGQLQLGRGELESPDATVDTDAQTFRELLFGIRSLDEIGNHELRVTGDREAVESLIAAVVIGARR